MVEETGDDSRIEFDLKMAALMLGDLPEIAEEWEIIGEGERESWCHDWDNEMVGVKQLLESAARAELTDDQARRLAQLLDDLDRARPLIERLDIRRPPARHSTQSPIERAVPAGRAGEAR